MYFVTVNLPIYTFVLHGFVRMSSANIDLTSTAFSSPKPPRFFKFLGKRSWVLGTRMLPLINTYIVLNSRALQFCAFFTYLVALVFLYIWP